MKVKYELAAGGTESVQPLKYPKAVFFIIGNEFCERYSTYGMQAILALYLRNDLLYSEVDAKFIYHAFVFLSYFFPLFGATLADSYIGKYKTLFYLSIVHAIGNITIALGATGWFFSQRILCLLGLCLTALGIGGIKPCVSTFGGDQFVLPQQSKQLKQFFSIFYFTNNVGGLVAALSSPILRQDISCLGKATCYPIAFGIPSFLMVIALILFVVGRPWYRLQKPKGNVLADSMKCICYALRRKVSSNEKSKQPSHWLDYASEKFDAQLVKDVREALKVIIMYVPQPFFYAILFQLGSSWIFQATQMDGVFFNWFTLKPDQVNFFNPLLVLIFIPFFEAVLYPMLAKIGVKRPLQFITIGAVLCSASFYIAAVVEQKLEPSYPVLPEPGLGQLRIFNGVPCQLKFDPAINEQSTIPPLGALQFTDIKVNETLAIEETLSLEMTCNSTELPSNWTRTIVISEKQSTSYVVSVVNGSVDLRRIPGFDDVTRTQTNVPKLRIIHNLNGTISLRNQYGKEFFFQLTDANFVTPLDEVRSGSYVAVYGNETIVSNLLIETGGVYTLVLQQVEGKIVGKLHSLTPPAALHIIWILPQIVVLSAAEIFFSLTYLSFTFTQAPESMRSLLQSVSNVAVSLGNLVVVIVSNMNMFHRKTHQFLFYATLMALDVILIIALAIPYKYKKYESAKHEKGMLELADEKMGVLLSEDVKSDLDEDENIKIDEMRITYGSVLALESGKPETENKRSETGNGRSETGTGKSETGSISSEVGEKSETKNEKSEMKDGEPGSENEKSESRNSKSETKNETESKNDEVNSPETGNDEPDSGNEEPNNNESKSGTIELGSRNSESKTGEEE